MKPDTSVPTVQRFISTLINEFVRWHCAGNEIQLSSNLPDRQLWTKLKIYFKYALKQADDKTNKKFVFNLLTVAIRLNDKSRV